MYVLLKFRKVHYGNIDQEHLSSPSTLGGGAFPIMAYISGGGGRLRTKGVVVQEVYQKVGFSQGERYEKLSFRYLKRPFKIARIGI